MLLQRGVRCRCRPRLAVHVALAGFRCPCCSVKPCCLVRIPCPGLANSSSSPQVGPVRLDPVGLDRHYNRYWLLPAAAVATDPATVHPGAPPLLVIERHAQDSLAPTGAAAAAAAVLGGPAPDALVGGGAPGWQVGVYNSILQLQQLAQWLCPKGTRERPLADFVARLLDQHQQFAMAHAQIARGPAPDWRPLDPAAARAAGVQRLQRAMLSFEEGNQVRSRTAVFMGCYVEQLCRKQHADLRGGQPGRCWQLRSWLQGGAAVELGQDEAGRHHVSKLPRGAMELSSVPLCSTLPRISAFLSGHHVRRAGRQRGAAAPLAPNGAGLVHATGRCGVCRGDGWLGWVARRGWHLARREPGRAWHGVACAWDGRAAWALAWHGMTCGGCTWLVHGVGTARSACKNGCCHASCNATLSHGHAVPLRPMLTRAWHAMPVLAAVPCHATSRHATTCHAT